MNPRDLGGYPPQFTPNAPVILLPWSPPTFAPPSHHFQPTRRHLAWYPHRSIFPLCGSGTDALSRDHPRDSRTLAERTT